MPFLGPNRPICPEQFFFGTKHYYYFHVPIGPFHCIKFLKNSDSGSRVIRMRHIRVQNSPFAQMRVFSENLLINLVSFIHAYLNAKKKKKSKSDINLLMQY